MRVAKPSKGMIKAVNEFVTACERVLEKEKFSFTEACDTWERDWDEEDDEYKVLKRIKTELADELGCSYKDVDNRIVCYEYLKRMYCNRLDHVVLTAEVLVDNVCDPQKDYLDYHPFLRVDHVDGDL
jgi:hypothetical protein